MRAVEKPLAEGYRLGGASSGHANAMGKIRTLKGKSRGVLRACILTYNYK